MRRLPDLSIDFFTRLTDVLNCTADIGISTGNSATYTTNSRRLNKPSNHSRRLNKPSNLRCGIRRCKLTKTHFTNFAKMDESPSTDVRANAQWVKGGHQLLRRECAALNGLGPVERTASIQSRDTPDCLQDTGLAVNNWLTDSWLGPSRSQLQAKAGI